MNLTPRNPLIEGVEVTLSTGAKLVVAPFNIKRSKMSGDYRGLIRSAANLDSTVAIESMVKIAGIALRANYPELTDEELQDECKMADLGKILVALNKANGGEQDTGEAKASATTEATPTQIGTD
jgi:hypothetical protein